MTFSLFGQDTHEGGLVPPLALYDLRLFFWGVDCFRASEIFEVKNDSMRKTTDNVRGWTLLLCVKTQCLKECEGHLTTGIVFCNPPTHRKSHAHHPLLLCRARSLLAFCYQGIPKVIEGNAKLLGDVLREKGFVVTQPEVRIFRVDVCLCCCVGGGMV